MKKATSTHGGNKVLKSIKILSVFWVGLSVFFIAMLYLPDKYNPLIGSFVVAIMIIIWMKIFVPQRKNIEANLFKLNRLAVTDQLTELPNRRHGMRLINKCIKDAERYERSFYLAIADLDDFKKINTNHGHVAGDRALKLVSKALKESLRATDEVFRYGGDEFVFVIEGNNGAIRRLESRVKNYLSQAFELNKIEFPLSLTFGSTKLSGKEKSTVAIERADKELLRKKHKVITIKEKGDSSDKYKVSNF